MHVVPNSDEAQKQIVSFQLPPGFGQDFVATEPDLCKEFAFAFDNLSCCYVAETFRINDGVLDARRHMRWGCRRLRVVSRNQMPHDGLPNRWIRSGEISGSAVRGWRAGESCRSLQRQHVVVWLAWSPRGLASRANYAAHARGVSGRRRDSRWRRRQRCRPAAAPDRRSAAVRCRRVRWRCSCALSYHGASLLRRCWVARSPVPPRNSTPSTISSPPTGASATAPPWRCAPATSTPRRCSPRSRAAKRLGCRLPRRRWSASAVVSGRTHNGSIEANVTAAQVAVETHNGTVELDVAGNGPLDGTITSHNGGIRVGVGQRDATIEAATHNGSIEAGEGMVATSATRNRWRGKIGDGSGKLAITTHNGSVTIR